MISKKVSYLLLTSLFFLMMVLRYPQDSTINITGDATVYPDRSLHIIEKGEIGFMCTNFHGKFVESRIKSFLPKLHSMY